MISFFPTASKATYNGNNVIAHAFHSCFVFELPLQQVHAFHVHVTVQASSGNVVLIVI